MPRPRRSANLGHAIQVYETTDRGYQSIAKEFQVSYRLLRDALIERGTLRDQRAANRLARERGEATRVAKRGGPLPDGDICAAYNAGMSEAELARTHGVSRDVIRRVLERNEVKRRTVAEALQLVQDARTPEEKARNAEAAHAAVRGRHWTFAQKCTHANSRHGKRTAVAAELLYDAWLRLRGIHTIPQFAIGPYNCDLAAEPVAVEIFGGNWHGSGKHAATFAERAHYILNEGWCLAIVWVDQSRQRLSEASADYLAALIEQARRDPSLRGQYRVIWGDGQVVSTAGRELDDFARVPPRRRTPKAG